MKTLKYFSLVELALGIAILAIGATAALTLIPSGIKENREAAGKNFVAIATQDIQSYIMSRALSESDFVNFINLFPSAEPDSSAALSSTSGLVKIEGADSSRSGIYASSANTTSGVYAVEFYSGDKLDFDAQLNIWKSYPYGGVDSGVSSGAGGMTVFAQNPVVKGVSTLYQSIPPIGSQTEVVIEGGINGINPANSDVNDFVLNYKNNDGTIDSIDIRILKDINNNTTLTYDVTSMEIRLKGNPNSSTLSINGVPIDTIKKKYYINAPSGKTFKITLSGKKSQWDASFNGKVDQIASGIYAPAENVSGVTVSGSKGTSKVVGINIELSWPVSKPYAQRAKYKYYFEIQEPS